MTQSEINPGKKNIYVCQNCRRHIVTRDVDEGTAPFLISCQATVGCAGRMRSSMYRVFDPENLIQWTHEWYRPGLGEIVRPHLIEHVRKGGLILRTSSGSRMPGTRVVRHKKRGTHYRVIAEGRMQSDHWVDPQSSETTSVDMREVTVYEGEDGNVWVRPKGEFEDGRFEG